MADDVTTGNPGPFDVATIKALVQLMARHDLNEIELRDGPQKIRLRRGMAAVPEPFTPPRVAAQPPAAAPQPAAAAAQPAPAAASARKLSEIKSPAIGTFYAAANPESPSFVRVGDRVTPTTPVCLVEAMKTFNEVLAECSGVIVEVVAQNGQSVEFNDVLFRVDPLG